MSSQLECARKIIEDKSVHKSVKALLLLRICTLISLQGKADREWIEPLQEYAKHLAGDERAAYESLGLGPEKQQRERGGFVASVVHRIEEARGLADTDEARAKSILRECEEELAKKWWRWGKAPAWSALLQAWSTIDRSEALRRLTRLSEKQQPKALQLWNRQRALSVEEWAIVEEAIGGRRVVPRSLGEAPRIDRIDSLARSGGPIPRLLTALFFDEDAEVVRTRLDHLLPVMKTAIDKLFQRDETGKQVDEERKKALVVLARIMVILSETAPDSALTVALWACKRGAGRDAFDKDFSFAFGQLAPLVMQTIEMAEGRQEVLADLVEALPKAYGDFARVHWYAHQAEDEDSARACHASLREEAQDGSNAVKLYLTMLCRTGLAETALSLAQESPESDELLPMVRRAWLCTDTASARGNVTQEHFPDDKVVQLLLLPDAKARGAFLRQLTDNGDSGLPADLWAPPGMSEIMAAQAGRSASGKGAVYGGFYAPETEKPKRFAEYVRLHSHGFIGHETVDFLLLGALVAWGEEHPREVEKVVQRMARNMRLFDELLMVDILRNTAFGRARAVLPAVPKVFLEEHVTWIKKTLVDDQIRIQVDANTVRVLSMPARVLFLFALMGAENVAKHSTRLAEELIAGALKAYQTDSEFLPMAARMYAAQEGLSKLEPPCSMPFQKREWQKGVVDAAVPLIAAEILGQSDAPAEAAPAMREE